MNSLEINLSYEKFISNEFFDILNIGLIVDGGDAIFLGSAYLSLDALIYKEILLDISSYIRSGRRFSEGIVAVLGTC